jgi:hypothetical protein
MGARIRRESPGDERTSSWGRPFLGKQSRGDVVHEVRREHGMKRGRRLDRTDDRRMDVLSALDYDSSV